MPNDTAVSNDQASHFIYTVYFARAQSIAIGGFHQHRDCPPITEVVDCDGKETAHQLKAGDTIEFRFVCVNGQASEAKGTLYYSGMHGVTKNLFKNSKELDSGQWMAPIFDGSRLTVINPTPMNGKPEYYRFSINFVAKFGSRTGVFMLPDPELYVGNGTPP